jgi:macrolide transport system ATP-binding/permease protein
MVSHDRQLGAWFAGRYGGTGPGAELRLDDGLVASFPVPV